MIERAIAAVFRPPERMLEDQVDPIDNPTFLIIKNNLFTFRNASNLDLINDRNGNREENILTDIDLIRSFHMNLNFLIFFIILNFDHRRIHDQNILLIEFRPLNPDLIHHLVMHMVGDCYHPVFDPHSIDSIFDFACVVLEKF